MAHDDIRMTSIDQVLPYKIRSLASILGEARDLGVLQPGMLSNAIRIARAFYPAPMGVTNLSPSQREIIMAQITPRIYHPLYNPIEARRYIS
jgi:hypothetical protein